MDKKLKLKIPMGMVWFENEFCAECNAFERYCNGENRNICIEAEKLRELRELKSIFECK